MRRMFGMIRDVHKGKIKVHLTLLLMWMRMASGENAPPQYREKWRPQYHYTPPKNFMNDPSGLVAFDGLYHLFYIYDPSAIGPVQYSSWGHAVSTDLVHWETWPLALPETAGVLVFSGSAVADIHNTTGFCTNDTVALIAIFTGHHPASDLSGQGLAYSLDGGVKWTYYDRNPVLDVGTTHFRDPKVFWHEPTKRWVMAVAQAMGKNRAIRLFSSPDLKNWTYLSEKNQQGLIATNEVETPNLFELRVTEENTTKWVLAVITGKGSRPRRSVMYWIGNFDGKQFVPDDIKASFVDFGYDFQAFQTWNNYVDDRVLMIGWMCVWDYCGLVPTQPWKGAQSLVRELSLEREASAIILVQKPVKQMEKLRSALKLELDKTDTLTARKMFRTNKVRGRSLEIKVEFKPHAKTKKVGFQIRSGEKEETIVCYDHFKEAVYIDRAKSGIIHKKMSLVDSANVVLQNGTLKLWIFLDWSSVEVFVNDGRQVITNLIFPQNDSSDEVDIFCLGHEAEVVSLKIYELNTTWEKYWNNNTWGGLTDNLKKVHIFKMNSIKAHSNLTEVSDSNYLWIFISVLIVCYGLLLNLLCRSFSRYF